MKGTMIILALPCLLLCWIPIVEPMAIRFNHTLPGGTIKLDMVADSVDDMYYGCDNQMLKMVMSKYYEEERALKQYAAAWKEAETCANRKIHCIQDKGLTKYHLLAICAYTSNRMYGPFNNAVRTGRKVYGSSFQFHSLHFLLTSAIQTLNRNNYCHNTYRRTGYSYTGEVNKRIRFGFFASSSYRTDLKQFGNETCFIIRTCWGAYLKGYSAYGYREQEVLIPPYEVFTITRIIKNPGTLPVLRDCRVVYVLNSAMVVSNLNCKLLQTAP